MSRGDPNVSAVQARGMVQEVEHPDCGPIKLVNTPLKYSQATPGVRTPPPTLGQHTDQIVGEFCGLADDDVARLKKEGALS